LIWEGLRKKQILGRKQKFNNKNTDSSPSLHVAGSLLTFGPQMSAQMSPPRRDCHNLFITVFILSLHHSLIFPVVLCPALIHKYLTKSGHPFSPYCKLCSYNNLIPLSPWQCYLSGTVPGT
jgi:hypothetical protein